MKRKSIEQLVEEYIDCCLEYERRFPFPDDGSCARANGRALRAYCKIREYGDAGLPALLALLDHPNRYVRCKIAYSLLWYDKKRAVAVLRKDIEINDAYARSHAMGLWAFKVVKAKHRDPYLEEIKRRTALLEKRIKAKEAKS